MGSRTQPAVGANRSGAPVVGASKSSVLCGRRKPAPNVFSQCIPDVPKVSVGRASVTAQRPVGAQAQRSRTPPQQRVAGAQSSSRPVSFAQQRRVGAGVDPSAHPVSFAQQRRVGAGMDSSAQAVSSMQHPVGAGAQSSSRPVSFVAQKRVRAGAESSSRPVSFARQPVGAGVALSSRPVSLAAQKAVGTASSSRPVSFASQHPVGAGVEPSSRPISFASQQRVAAQVNPRPVSFASQHPVGAGSSARPVSFKTPHPVGAGVEPSARPTSFAAQKRVKPGLEASAQPKACGAKQPGRVQPAITLPATTAKLGTETRRNSCPNLSVLQGGVVPRRNSLIVPRVGSAEATNTHPVAITLKQGAVKRPSTGSMGTVHPSGAVKQTNTPVGSAQPHDGAATKTHVVGAAQKRLGQMGQSSRPVGEQQGGASALPAVAEGSMIPKPRSIKSVLKPRSATAAKQPAVGAPSLRISAWNHHDRRKQLSLERLPPPKESDGDSDSLEKPQHAVKQKPLVVGKQKPIVVGSKNQGVIKQKPLVVGKRVPPPCVTTSVAKKCKKQGSGATPRNPLGLPIPLTADLYKEDEEKHPVATKRSWQEKRSDNIVVGKRVQSTGSQKGLDSQVGMQEDTDSQEDWHTSSHPEGKMDGDVIQVGKKTRKTAFANFAKECVTAAAGAGGITIEEMYALYLDKFKDHSRIFNCNCFKNRIKAMYGVDESTGLVTCKADAIDLVTVVENMIVEAGGHIEYDKLCSAVSYRMNTVTGKEGRKQKFPKKMRNFLPGEHKSLATWLPENGFVLDDGWVCIGEDE